MTNKTVTSQDLARSVLAVPPLARKRDYALDPEANRKILAHLDRGGVTTAIYGGNANLYNISVREFGALLDMLDRVAPSGMWIVPSIGPDFGKCLDQVDILRERDLPTAMVLPLNFPASSSGVARGLTMIAERYGRPLVAYVKSENFITAPDLAAVVADGAVCAVKYAVVRDNPEADGYLDELVSRIGPEMIISGIGERPAFAHLTRFGLSAFTSGSVCIAPAMSMALLRAIKAGRLDEAQRIRSAFLPLEDLRDGHSPLKVLHAAVGLAGIAETGPMLPFLDEIADAGVLGSIKGAAAALLAADNRFMAEPVSAG
jgi:dihydrodipicolinate synthase/N-acetylneuraminate lyase